MPTDWEWMFSSESGRDSLLRNEIEGLQASASSARAQSARLTSQLARLQGSLDTRLSALSAAFDAYVELGDVREQLAGYPDTSAIRRDAVTAIDTLSRGGRPKALDHRELDYWLSYAVNAVIALVAGAPDAAAEQRATELSPEAEWFIVAAAGALDVGPAVGSRVAPLLICDASLSPRQLVLWRAVGDGIYGDILPRVGEVWRNVIDADADAWVGWVRDQSTSSTPLEALRWLDRETSALVAGAAPRADSASDFSAPTSPVPADQLALGDAKASTKPPVPDAQTGLRGVVITLVGQGMGDEAALLERARTLRAKIEDPTRPAPGGEEVARPEHTVTDEVQDALLATQPGSPARHELLDWIRPSLLAATAAFAQSAQVAVSTDVTLRTDAGLIEVSEDGARPERLQRAEASIAEAHTWPISQLVVPAAAAVLAAFLALLSAVNDRPPAPCCWSWWRSSPPAWRSTHFGCGAAKMAVVGSWWLSCTPGWPTADARPAPPVRRNSR